jgi:hypothetical protein
VLTKILAWTSLALTIIFAILTLAAVFAGSQLGALVPTLIIWGAVPVAAVAILLAVTLLVLSAWQS